MTEETPQVLQSLDAVQEKVKSVKVGRIWINGNVLSGYVMTEQGCLRFGADIEFCEESKQPAFLYLTKQKR